MIARQFQNGGGAKAAVEMIVQQHLRQRADERFVERHVGASLTFCAHRSVA